MSRTTKRILIGVLALAVLWFTAGAGIFYEMGKGRIRRGTESTEDWVHPTHVYQTPPSDDFYTGYEMLQLAAMSPLFRDAAQDQLSFHVIRVSALAALIQAMVLGVVPSDMTEASRAGWQRLIQWVEENRGDIDDLLETRGVLTDTFEHVFAGIATDIKVIDDDHALVSRQYDLDYDYVALIDNAGNQLWGYPVSDPGGLGLSQLATHYDGTLFLRGLDEPSGAIRTTALALSNGAVLWQQQGEAVGNIWEMVPRGLGMCATADGFYQLDQVGDGFVVTRRDVRSGDEQWRVELTAIDFDPRLMRCDGLVLVDHPFGLTIVDVATGQLEEVAMARSRPALYGDSAVFMRPDGLWRQHLVDGTLTHIDLTPHLGATRCDAPHTWGIGGVRGNRWVVPVTCENAPGQYRLLLVYLTPEPFGVDGVWDVGPFRWLEPIVSEVVERSPQHAPLAGQLLRFVPVRVESADDNRVLLVLDLDERRIARTGTAWSDLLHWDLFRVGDRHFARSSDSLAWFAGDSGELVAAIQLDRIWNARPDLLAGGHAWVAAGLDVGRLNLDSFTYTWASGDVPAVSDVRSALAPYLGSP